MNGACIGQQERGAVIAQAVLGELVCGIKLVGNSVCGCVGGAVEVGRVCEIILAVRMHV